MTIAHTSQPSAAGPSSLAVLLARWFEARLHDAVVGHPSLVRLYGIDLVDPESLGRLAPDAARVRFVGEAPSIERLRCLPESASVHDHDAIAFVSTRWLPIDDTRPARPGVFGRRKRARVVHVLIDGAVAAVARFDSTDAVVVLPAA